MIKKNIAIFLDNDHYFSLIFLNFFFKAKNKNNYIVFLGKEFLNFKRILISFKILSLKQFLFISFNVFKNKISGQVQNYLKKEKIAFYDNLDINSLEVLSVLKKNNIKDCLSIINSQIFKKKKYKNFNIYNLHLGKIPEFKGIVPIINAYIKGQKVFYSTVFKISFKGIDSGDIIFQSNIKLSQCSNLFNVYEKLYSKGFKDIKDLSVKIELNKRVRKQKVKQKFSNYYSYPNLSEILKLKRF